MDYITLDHREYRCAQLQMETFVIAIHMLAVSDMVLKFAFGPACSVASSTPVVCPCYAPHSGPTGDGIPSKARRSRVRFAAEAAPTGWKPGVTRLSTPASHIA